MEFNSVAHSVVGDVPVDNKTPMVTSKILIEGRVCVHVFIGCECACVVSVGVVLCDLKKDRDVFWRSPDFICY